MIPRASTYYLIPRYAHYEDPLYQLKPFDPWHAWQDLIGCAAYRDGVLMSFKQRTVKLERGQILTSIRALAEKWGWSPSSVHRFLGELDKRGTTETEVVHGGTLITIVNYGDWQNPKSYTGTKLEQLWNSSETVAPVTPSKDGDLESLRRLEGKKVLQHPGDGVNNSVDNPSMPRKVAEVVEAFQQASKSTRPPSIPDKLAVEKAIKANGGDHIPIRECVRKATAEGVAYAKQSGSDPPRGVRYGLAAWSRRNERGPDPRPAERREPESRPMSPAYHRPVKPVPTRRMTNDESRAGVKHVADVLKALLRPDRSGK